MYHTKFCKNNTVKNLSKATIPVGAVTGIINIPFLGRVIFMLEAAAAEAGMLMNADG